MLKFFLFGLGCILIFEGLFYFFFSKKIKEIFQLINYLNTEKIKSISLVLIFLGSCLIYFTFKFYEFK